jgi:hypothetical protein
MFSPWLSFIVLDGALQVLRTLDNLAPVLMKPSVPFPPRVWPLRALSSRKRATELGDNEVTKQRAAHSSGWANPYPHLLPSGGLTEVVRRLPL